MVTHQDAGVWADLALILWAAGLRVTAAWTVATETPYGNKDGIPAGLDNQLWKRLAGEEKLYLKCLEVKSHGDYRNGVFQELARGCGVRDYRFMLESGKANRTRLKTASEFARKEWGTPGFGSSLLRHALFAVYRATKQDETKAGHGYLKTELPGYYWTHRATLTALLGYLGRLCIPHFSWNGVLVCP